MDNTSGYQVFDLHHVELYWENYQLDVNAAFGPCIDTAFSSSTFQDFEMDSMAENPILIDEEQDKENSLPFPTTPVSDRPTQPTVLIRRCPFGKKTENVPD